LRRIGRADPHAQAFLEVKETSIGWSEEGLPNTFVARLHLESAKHVRAGKAAKLVATMEFSGNHV
jgi:hypothetical protein